MSTVTTTTQTPKTSIMQRFKKKGIMGSLNAAGSVAEAGLEFYTRRKMYPEESAVKSAAYAAASFAEWTIAPGLMWGLTLGSVGSEATKQLVELGLRGASNKQNRWNAGGQIGGNFQDSEKGYTARQRGLQAIEQSRMNARSALGNEARSLHMR